jgi:hypothetical protein
MEEGDREIAACLSLMLDYKVKVRLSQNTFFEGNGALWWVEAASR